MAGLEGRALDRYQLRQLIGRGGMADVYLGYDPHFEREVAIKVFKREDEEMLKRFIREARFMASLRNEHLMPIYDAGESELDGAPLYFIVMPLMGGGTLRARTRRSPLSLKEACSYLRDIASALDYVHAQGIIHRDIKSSNVLLDAEGRCYLADFGIARATGDSTQLTSTGNVLGTVDYVAPELFEPNRKADERSDLYSLGVLLFEMVTGRLPFVGDNQLAVVAMHVANRPPTPSSIVPNIPPQVDQVILRALQKRPELRYGSATGLAQAFCEAVTVGASNQQRVSSPAWGQQESGVRQQPEGPLVLPPVQTTNPAPRIPPAEVYPYTSEARQTPAFSAYPEYQPPQPPGRKTTSPARKQARVVTVIALLALLAVVGPIVYVLLTAHPATQKSTSPSPVATISNTTPSLSATASLTATPNQTATAEAVAATAAAQARNATATAIAGATATVQAQVTATAGVIQTATAGNAAYSDPLDDPNRPATQNEQWQQDSHCAFKTDGYHVMAGGGVLGQGVLQGCLENATQYANFAITVDVTILNGHTGGLFFRVKPQTLGAYSGYLFEIDTNGNYKISLSKNFSLGTGNTTLQDWTASPAVKAGSGVKNTLQVLARNGSLLFYINGHFLAPDIQDTTFSTGSIAFLATTLQGQQSADVAYSNLNVYVLP